MPTGVYPRTEKHSFNKGKKHPNRKRYSRGITLCHHHHPRKREDEKRLSPYFQELLKVL